MTEDGFNHIALNIIEFKMYELLVSGIFLFTFSDGSHSQGQPNPHTQKKR